MSTKRPSVWSYVSFSRPSSFRGESRSPVLPSHGYGNDRYDRFEKPQRHAGTGGVYSASYEPNGRTALAFQPRRKGVRTRYAKYGAGLAFVVFLLYMFVPWQSSDDKFAKEFGHIDTLAPITPPADFQNAAAEQHKSVTTKCTKPHDPSKPLLQYALMVDAGSTGSRIHAYRFNNCGSTPELEDELFKMTEKKKGGSGLSSYDSDSLGAAQSLDVLLDAAVAYVPKEYQSCSPIAVKATAGLRKLGAEKSDKILKAVRKRLETQYPFPVLSAERGGVEVMEGTDEGVYAWITTNYLLGNIGGPEKSPTAAVFDLGGGSTQIVFEPTFPQAADGGMPSSSQMQDGDHKYALTFGGQNFSLYQHSYLGYGLMAARENLHQLVFNRAYENIGTLDPATFLVRSIENPCIAHGEHVTIDVPLPKDHALLAASKDPSAKSVKIKMTGPMSTKGAHEAAEDCLLLARATLRKESPCKLTPCAFDGVYQPPLASTFASETVYLFSYFYDRLSPLGIADETDFSLSHLADLTNNVCLGDETGGWDDLELISGAIEELDGRPETCLDLSFMLALLTHGYGMGLDREVRIAKKIQGNELGWCLGASLPLLSQDGWTCKITETT